MSIFYETGFSFMLRAYAAGFERAIFKVATPTEWASLRKRHAKHLLDRGQCNDIVSVIPFNSMTFMIWFAVGVAVALWPRLEV